MRIVRTELLQVLGRVAAGLSKAGYLEQSNCFVFRDGQCLTFNDDVCCRTRSGLPDDLEGAVLAAPLVKALEMLTDDEIDVAAAGTHLVFGTGRKKIKVVMADRVLLPVDDIDPPDEWHTLPEEFDHAVDHAAQAAGSNDDEFITTCLHFSPEFVEACDRTQLIRYHLDLKSLTGDTLVKAKHVKPVARLGMRRWGETPQWLHFRNKTVTYSVRRHVMEYPELGEIARSRGTSGTLPRGAAEAAHLAAVFSGDDTANDLVTVELKPGLMVVSGRGDNGEASADLETDYTGPPVAFLINPKTLVRIVEKHHDVEFSDSKLIVRGERWSYVAMLTDPEAPATVPVEDTPE